MHSISKMQSLVRLVNYYWIDRFWIAFIIVYIYMNTYIAKSYILPFNKYVFRFNFNLVFLNLLFLKILIHSNWPVFSSMNVYFYYLFSYWKQLLQELYCISIRYKCYLICNRAQLFLLHMDEILPRSLQQRNSVDQPIGCTTICVNQPDCEVIGHSEDALAATLNHYYIVAAHIISDTPQGKYQVRQRLRHQGRWTNSKYKFHFDCVGDRGTIHVAVLCRPSAGLHDGLQSSRLGGHHQYGVRAEPEGRQDTYGYILYVYVAT